MKVDEYNRYSVDEREAITSLYNTPDLDISKLYFRDKKAVDRYNNSIDETYSDLPKAKMLEEILISPEEWHKQNQQDWNMPQNYKDLDIAKYVLDKCNDNEAELQRVGEELLEFQNRDLFPLLCYLKYLVDVMKENNIVWGVGRGSSTASFVLYLIGVHRINSIYYDLPFNEFMR